MPNATETDDRISRRQVDKFAERRGQLAQSALKTLSELGYAHTSLREIAQNSEFSHGVLHYYFADKVDLITACVRAYKAECVTRYDDLVDSATSASDLKIGFGAAMAGTLRDDAPYHRLWYDLRNQSLFDQAYRNDVDQIDQALEQMIWRIVSKYAALLRVAVPVEPAYAYALFDGLFQHSLLRFVAGDEGAPDELAPQVEQLLTMTFDCAS